MVLFVLTGLSFIGYMTYAICSLWASVLKNRKTLNIE